MGIYTVTASLYYMAMAILPSRNFKIPRNSISLAVIVVVLCIITIPVSLLTASQYNAMTSAIQAAAVVPAVAIAALALNRDSRDKRVDRVLDLHREYNSGELKDAKKRLGTHLREHGVNGHVRPTTHEELRDDPTLSRYSSISDHDPRSDATEILYFFERVNAARTARTVDELLLVELICRSAAWWSLAIKDSIDQVPRAPLRELADWGNAFALANQGRYTSLRSWGQNRRREFGEHVIDPADIYNASGSRTPNTSP